MNLCSLASGSRVQKLKIDTHTRHIRPLTPIANIQLIQLSYFNISDLIRNLTVRYL